MYPVVSLRRSVLPHIVLPLLAGMALGVMSLSSPRAGESHIFVIAASEGYGVGDCLAEGGACGRVVAAAWCEAHGHRSVVAFGRAEDVSSAIASAETAGAGVSQPERGSPPLERDSLVISCSE